MQYAYFNYEPVTVFCLINEIRNINVFKHIIRPYNAQIASLFKLSFFLLKRMKNEQIYDKRINI